jgi:hypothetical protein
LKKKERFILAPSFRGFTPRSVGLVALGLGKGEYHGGWEHVVKKAAHLMEARKQSKKMRGRIWDKM